MHLKRLRQIGPMCVWRLGTLSCVANAVEGRYYDFLKINVSKSEKKWETKNIPGSRDAYTSRVPSFVVVRVVVETSREKKNYSDAARRNNDKIKSRDFKLKRTSSYYFERLKLNNSDRWPSLLNSHDGPNCCNCWGQMLGFVDSVFLNWDIKFFRGPLSLCHCG